MNQQPDTTVQDQTGEEVKPRSFIVENPRANFKLTEVECATLETLSQWQASSSRSTIVLGKPLQF